jgi:hypothetical protein
MRHVPQYAFYAAMAVLLAGSLLSRSEPSGRHKAALSLSMESGHVSIRAELGEALLALRI